MARSTRWLQPSDLRSLAIFGIDNAHILAWCHRKDRKQILENELLRNSTKKLIVRVGFVNEHMSFASCETITTSCPVEATVYGYLPNLGGNIFFLAFFGILLVIQACQGIVYKTWTWLVLIGIGLFLEVIGYAGRIMMHNNPWNSTGFEMQLACLILAPSFISGTIDLVLARAVLFLGSEYSRIPASYYAGVFIGADLLSIILQAIGGGLATSHVVSTFETGNSLMLAGIIIQVIQLSIFGAVALEYGIRTYRHRTGSERLQNLSQEWSNRFKKFILACTAAFLAILTRCIYRIPELAQGWGGELMRDEPSFLVLDGG